METDWTGKWHVHANAESAGPFDQLMALLLQQQSELNDPVGEIDFSSYRNGNSSNMVIKQVGLLKVGEE